MESLSLMKNRFIFIIIFALQFLNFTNLNSDETIKLESTKIELLDKGNIIKSSKGVKVDYLDELTITKESVPRKFQNKHGLKTMRTNFSNHTYKTVCMPCYHV